MKLRLTFFLIMIVTILRAQDTIVVDNNYTFKIGIKPCAEASADITQRSNGYNTYWQAWRVGVQFIRKIIKKSRSSIESGIYYTTKAREYRAFYYPYGYSNLIIYTDYLSIPINYRYDTKVIYVTGGIFVDYLVGHTSEYNINSIYDYGIDRKLNVGYNIAVGVEKQITRQMNFFAEGILFHTVSWPKVSAGHKLVESNFKTTYRNYGVAVGLNYKLLYKRQ